MPPVLQLRDVRLTLGGHPLLEGAELSVAPRERIALVGRNGSGKSTLLRIAAGEIEPDAGTRFAQPGARLRYLQQEPDLAAFETALDFVLDGLGEDDDPHRARTLMEELGVDPAARTASLSGGEARRAALVRALAPAPEVLLLDEPTNHLDLLAIEWLEKELAQTRSAFVLISHDKRLLSNLTNATVWLDRGATRRLDQGFAAFEAWRDQILEEEEAERHKLDRRIVMEEHWLRYGVTARRKRNMRRVGELGQMRKERREARRVLGEVKMTRLGGGRLRQAGDRGGPAEQILRRAPDRQGFFDPRRARRPARRDRRERRGQDDARQSPDRRPRAGLRDGAPRRRASKWRRWINVAPAWSPTTPLVDALTGGGSDCRRGQRPAQACRRLHEGFPVRTRTGAHADRQIVGRRARAA